MAPTSNEMGDGYAHLWALKTEVGVQRWAAQQVQLRFGDHSDLGQGGLDMHPNRKSVLTWSQALVTM